MLVGREHDREEREQDQQPIARDILQVEDRAVDIEADVPGFQVAEARMAAMMPAMSKKLMLPLTRKLAAGGVSPTVVTRRSLR